MRYKIIFSNNNTLTLELADMAAFMDLLSKAKKKQKFLKILYEDGLHKYLNPNHIISIEAIDMFN